MHCVCLVLVNFAYKMKWGYNASMTTMTIPKTFRASDDLIVIARREYESLKARAVPEFTPTKSDLLALARARRNFRAGKSISLAQLKRDLANRN